MARVQLLIGHRFKFLLEKQIICDAHSVYEMNIQDNLLFNALAPFKITKVTW
jgi:hypothetical protein